MTKPKTLFRFLVPVLAILSLPLSVRATDSMTIVVYGASGKIGGMIVDVALERAHSVIGVSRNPGKLSRDSSNFIAVKGDVSDPASILSTTRRADAIIISVTGAGEGNKPENSLEARAAHAMIEAYGGREQRPRVVQIGGATTMYGSVEAMERNLPFPAEKGSSMHGMLFGHKVVLDAYRESTIPWTVITPPMHILGWSPQGITDARSSRGTYRTSTTEILKDKNGKSEIYVRDLANAAVDAAESGKFTGQRVMVSY